MLKHGVFERLLRESEQRNLFSTGIAEGAV